MLEQNKIDALSDQSFLKRRQIISRYWRKVGHELSAAEATFPAFIQEHKPESGRYVINGTVSKLLDHLQEEALELAEAISAIQEAMASEAGMVSDELWDDMLREHGDVLYLSTAIMLAWPPGSSWTAEATATIRNKLTWGNRRKI